MREIKFRAWSEKNKEMFFGKDVEYWHDGSSLQGRVMPLKADRYDVSPVLMQYTGLKDKNGKEIYEGDIVLTTHIIQKGIIEYQWHGFQIKSITGGMYVGDSYKWDDIEIIGNVFETPELLQK